MGPDEVAKRCTEDDCDRPRYARGWCSMHYKRWLRAGTPYRTPPKRTCSIEGCERPVAARGWCHGHYQRWYRTGDVAPENPLSDRRKAPCEVEACERQGHARGLCQTHYRRMLQHGDPRPESPIRIVTGEGFVNHGYWRVPVPPELRHLTGGARTETEHRLRMAVSLGRPLADDENVHHINGDRLDNRLENLELWSTAQPSGQRVSDKVDFALMILKRYVPNALHDPDST